jgi:histidinol dehydrogenase
MKTVSKNWIFKNLKLFNQNDSKVKPIVQSIIRDVQHNGDKALLKYVKKFENSKAELKDLVFSKKQLAHAYQSLSLKDRKALQLAHQRIHYYHSKQVRKSYSFPDQQDSKFHINGILLKMWDYMYREEWRRIRQQC